MVLALVGLIFYFNLKQNSLEEPRLVMQPKVSSDSSHSEKETFTKQKVGELVESKEFKRYRRDKEMGRLRIPDDDETVSELREKEDELF